MVPQYKEFDDDEAGYLAWMTQNPNGFVLNTDRAQRIKYIALHTASCRTIKVPLPSARTSPFTGHRYKKICANDINELRKWVKAQGLEESPKVCSKCNPDTPVQAGASIANEAISNFESTGDNWSEEELRASVKAYLDMQRKEHAQQPFKKSECYVELFKQFGRTPSAFEFRMQNISYVLSLMGRDWLKGLRPAKNVGKKVATRIEALVLEVSQSAQVPVVSFEMEVRENFGNKELPKPAGSKKPATTTSQVVQYKRDPLVKAWVLNQSAGVCECCSHAAPFKNTDGQPFLEVHHVRKLAEGGSDTTSNAVAICPNCHRALHYGMKAKELVEGLFTKLPRLVRE